MSSLFDIVGEFKQLYEIMTDDEVDEQLINDSLESLTGELEQKSAGYVAVINQMQMEAEACKKQAEFFTYKQKVRENSIKRLKQALCNAMLVTDNTEIQAGQYKLKVQNNGGAQPLVITGDVPDNMTKITIAPDNSKIREYLSEHECEWAHLEPRGKHLVIK